MLRFEIQPDPVFLVMLDAAIEYMIFGLDLDESSDQDESFAVNMP